MEPTTQALVSSAAVDEGESPDEDKPNIPLILTTPDDDHTELAEIIRASRNSLIEDDDSFQVSESTDKPQGSRSFANHQPLKSNGASLITDDVKDDANVSRIFNMIQTNPKANAIRKAQLLYFLRAAMKVSR